MYGAIVLLLDCGGEIKDNGDRPAIPNWQKHCGTGFGRRSKLDGWRKIAISLADGILNRMTETGDSSVPKTRH